MDSYIAEQSVSEQLPGDTQKDWIMKDKIIDK